VRPSRGELGLLAGGLICGLALAEATVRVVDRGPRPSGYAPVRTEGPNLGPYNSLLYRDYERSQEKPPGVRRIVLLGDSFTWGWRILFDDTFGQRIERDLRRRRLGKETWEVVNLARPRLDTAQEAEILSKEGLAYCPDVVILGYTLNDSDDQNSPEVRRAAAWLRDAEDSGPVSRLLHRSALFRLVATRISATLENRWRVAGRRLTYSPDYPGWLTGQKALRAMARMCHEEGVPLVVLIFPDFGVPLDDRYPFADIHTRISNAAAAAGARVVDLLPSYRGLKEELLVVEGAADTHPSELAHRIAALTLFRALREILPPPGSTPPRACGGRRADGRR